MAPKKCPPSTAWKKAEIKRQSTSRVCVMKMTILYGIKLSMNKQIDKFHGLVNYICFMSFIPFGRYMAHWQQLAFPVSTLTHHKSAIQVDLASGACLLWRNLLL